jgi:SAM-dependent methyltransferase
MTIESTIKDLVPPVLLRVGKHLMGSDGNWTIRRYLSGGSVPWSRGYTLYRQKYIQKTLDDDDLLSCFYTGNSLPEGYGVGIDERCVEYPWLFSNLSCQSELVLDAGSALNHQFLLEREVFINKNLHILTLAPETNCFWNKGISYLFSDLRKIPIQSSYYDTIVCLSTLEHVGCDNSSYTQRKDNSEKKLNTFTDAIRELHRVLKPGGQLFLSVPFGAYEFFGSFQQFDQRHLEIAINAFQPCTELQFRFYLYTETGWQVASETDCRDSHYVKSVALGQLDSYDECDKAAAARSVACLQLKKTGG